MPGVLMIANDFPPIGGAGVQRSLYFAKYLPTHGWAPVVLTVKEVLFPAKDPSLLEELPPETRIVRSESFELRRLAWLASKLVALHRRRGEDSETEGNVSAASTSAALGSRLRDVGRALRRWLFVPDDRVLWAPFAIFKALRLSRRHDLRVTYATVPPYSSAVIGLMVSRLASLPLVVDLRDPWTHDPYLPSPTPLHARLNEMLEATTLRHAARTIVISQRMADVFRDLYPQLRSDRLKVITNGYDASAFADIEPIRQDDGFVLAYVGSLYEHHRAVLRGLLAAWSRLAEADRDFAERARLELTGRCDPEIREELEAWPRVEARVLGYLPHREAIAHLKGAHSLLLLIKDLDPERDVITIPGKLFEYVGAGPPILMLGPEGDAAEIVRRTGGEVRTQDDLEGIVTALRSLFANRCEGGDPTSTGQSDWVTARRRYDRAALSAELAAVLDQATGVD